MAFPFSKLAASFTVVIRVVSMSALKLYHMRNLSTKNCALITWTKQLFWILHCSACIVMLLAISRLLIYVIIVASLKIESYIRYIGDHSSGTKICIAILLAVLVKKLGSFIWTRNPDGPYDSVHNLVTIGCIHKFSFALYLEHFHGYNGVIFVLKIQTWILCLLYLITTVAKYSCIANKTQM